ncbi:type VI secretion system protein TssA, partial [Klebsiella aerogenes]
SDALRITGALLIMEQAQEGAVPGALCAALETRLMKSGGPEAVVPQNISDAPLAAVGGSAPVLSGITSGQELLTQARVLAKYLSDQPDGWLSAHHLIKSIRHDTLHQLPPLLADGRTRIDPPKPDQRALLKRLYLQQSWMELLEQASEMFSRGAN